jgi:hypothetical protein
MNFSILFLGVKSAGKSTLIAHLKHKMTKEVIPQNIAPTMVMDVSIVKNANMQLFIWEVAESAGSYSLMKNFMKTQYKKVVVLVWDGAKSFKEQLTYLSSVLMNQSIADREACEYVVISPKYRRHDSAMADKPTFSLEHKKTLETFTLKSVTVIPASAEGKDLDSLLALLAGVSPAQKEISKPANGAHARTVKREKITPPSNGTKKPERIAPDVFMATKDKLMQQYSSYSKLRHLLNHHHRGRAAAMAEAIEVIHTPDNLTSLLKNQTALFEQDRAVPPLNQAVSHIIDTRWTQGLSNKPKLAHSSGFYRITKAGLDALIANPASQPLKRKTY